jgi:septum formation protein
MRELNDLQIKKYLSADNPIDCAGSYKLELNGISLFKKIETEDQTAIIGLPLLSLADDLISLGHTIPPY